MINLLEHTRRPDISFCRKRGTIRISAKVARVLALRPGDSINIAVSGGEIPCRRMQSGACSCSAERRRNCNQVEYLLHAVHLGGSLGRHEARCWPTKKGSDNYCACSVRLCRSLLDAVGIRDDKVAYHVGEAFVRAGTTYVPVITLHPLPPDAMR